MCWNSKGLPRYLNRFFLKVWLKFSFISFSVSVIHAVLIKYVMETLNYLSFLGKFIVSMVQKAKLRKYDLHV